jgi:hypothetical protein
MRPSMANQGGKVNSAALEKQEACDIMPAANGEEPIMKGDSFKWREELQ